MTTTNPTLAGLYRAVLLDPADDMARLVYADALAEAGEFEREEFIRCQLTLANMESAPRGVEHVKEDAVCWEDLRRRERSAWDNWATSAIENAMHADEPWGGLPGTVSGHWPCGVATKLPYEVHFEFRRGFVDSVTLPLAAFMGPCPRCAGDGAIAPSPRSGFVGQMMPLGRDCPACAASGSLAAALVLAAPLTSVRLADREPADLSLFRGQHGWFWEPGIRQDFPRHIPFEIGKVGGWKVSFISGLMIYRFDTEGAAHAALSAACVLHARTLAKLETPCPWPLPPGVC